MHNVSRGITFSVLAALAAGVLAAPTLAGQGVGIDSVSHAESQLEQRLLMQEYDRLPENTRIRLENQSLADGIELPLVLRNLAASGRLLPQQPKETIFRGIKDELKPVVIRQNQFVDTFATRPLPAAAIPQAAEAVTMLRLAASVGRIEIANAPRHVGTGFVIGDGLIATNCHVLRELIAVNADGTWRLKNEPASQAPFLIDFSDGRAHDSENEFVIESIAGFPSAAFLDVAVLRVRTQNIANNKRLPPPLTTRNARVDHDWAAGPLPVGVIGYPDYTNLRRADELTKRLFRQIWEQTSNNVKLFSPGSVVGMDTFADIDFLDHVASTLQGQSGSPVIDRRSGEVIGVHYCCSQPGVPAVVDTLACSSQRVSDLENNQAVGIWTARQDAVLRSFIN